MTLTLERKQSKATVNRQDYAPIYKKWEIQRSGICAQIEQLKSTFEKASFILTKRDFDRLAALELLQVRLQKKITRFFQSIRHLWFEPDGTIDQERENLAGEIEQGLASLSAELTNLQKEKFAKKNKFTVCL